MAERSWLAHWRDDLPQLKQMPHLTDDLWRCLIGQCRARPDRLIDVRHPVEALTLPVSPCCRDE
jgi:hypothetical protein